MRPVDWVDPRGWSYFCGKLGTVTLCEEVVEYWTGRTVRALSWNQHRGACLGRISSNLRSRTWEGATLCIYHLRRIEGLYDVCTASYCILNDWLVVSFRVFMQKA